MLCVSKHCLHLLAFVLSAAWHMTRYWVEHENGKTSWQLLDVTCGEPVCKEG
jgi:hypothetical protein